MSRPSRRFPLVPLLLLLALGVFLVLVRQQNVLARRLRETAERLDRLERGSAAAPILPPLPAAATPASSGGAATETPRAGGTLRLSLSQSPDTFNPITGKTLEGFFVSLLVCEPLFVLDPLTRDPVPVLAESCEPSDGGLTWTVRLREGVTWSDGVPLTADDVAFSLETVLDPRVATYSAREFRYETAAGERVVEIERVDDRTIRFRQPIPYVAFPHKLAFKAIVPRHRLAAARERGEFQTAWNVTTPPGEIVGTGPFLVERYEPGSAVHLRRNPRYWRRDAEGRPLPYLDRIVWVVTESPDAALLQFQSGGLELLVGPGGTGIRATDVALLRKGEAAGGWAIVDAGPSVDLQFLSFNQNTGSDPRTGRPHVDPRKLEWFRDARFRRAVAHCVDRETIAANVYHGLAEPADSVFPRGTGRFHDPGVPAVPYDLAAARSLLEALGMSDRDGDSVREDAAGAPVEFRVMHTGRRGPEEAATLSVLVDRLASVGVRAVPRRVDPNTYTRALFDTFEWEALLGGDSGGAYEPKGDDPLWSSGAPYHLWFPNQEPPSTPWEARVDAIFRLASLEFDWGKRRALLFEFQQIVARELPVILTVQPRVFFAASKRVANFRPAPSEPNPLHNVHEIFLR